MFHRLSGATMRFGSFSALILSVWFGCASSSAATIGAWEGSERTWTSLGFSGMYIAVTTAGSTIEPDGPMTAAYLANDDVFIIGQPGWTPLNPELSALSTWIQQGGVLLMFADDWAGYATYLNAISGGHWQQPDVGRKSSKRSDHGKSPGHPGVHGSVLSDNIRACREWRK